MITERQAMKVERAAEEFSDRLCSIVSAQNIFRAEPLYRHTTFRVGGPADWFLQVGSTEELKNVIALCKEYEEPCQIIGNGSNLLVSDEGFQGVLIKLSGGEFETVTVSEERTTGIGTVTAGAGATLFRLAFEAGRKGFTGLEFAAGIPGTVGGGIWMNAGAYGGEMKQSLSYVEVLTSDGEIKTVAKEELQLSYRHSILQENGAIVLKAVFQLTIKPRIQIFAEMASYKKARQEKQPLEYPSAGSTFKRPEGYFAGKLIQDAGLSGCQIGGAAVSAKHAGFIINTGNASASDIYRLIEHVKKTVWEKFQVKLETEVRFLGKF